MQSSDPGHFFETDATQAQRERRAAKASNTHGNPFKLKSKINAVVADPHSPQSVFVAESAGRVRRLDLESQTQTAVYRGPTVPVTCLAVGGKDDQVLFAGSWDKLIWSWDIPSSRLGRKYDGHSDFVKSVVCARISGVDLLISGGADRKIIVWNVETGTRLHTLQDPTTPMMAVQHLAIDPVLTTPDEVVLASAGSDPHIRRWRITLADYEQLRASDPDKPGAERPTVNEHDSGVYRLVFDRAGDDADLLTASADGTARRLARARGFGPDDAYAHGGHVRAVAATDRWVVTGGRDEHVRVWDREGGALRYTLEGHFDEVTDLAVLAGRDGRPAAMCSVGLDGTVRAWPLEEGWLEQAVEEMRKPPEPPKEEEKGSGMTAEEEAELAALMDED